MYDVDIVIVGAGAVGLGIAHAITDSCGNLDVVVLEKETAPGKGISSRSSEVIHAGIYHKENLLKTKLCVEGSRLLYEFCEKYDVPFSRIGKLVVAVKPEETDSVERLYDQGILNGVSGLKLLDTDGIKTIEPYVNGIVALYSENTGIIDSHVFIKRLELASLKNNVKILCKTELTGIDRVNGGYVCKVRSGSEEYCFGSRVIINSAGLNSDSIAEMAGINVDAASCRIFKVKGEYFRIKPSKAAMLNGLVYPSPEKSLAGLGIHATKDTSGNARLGPNAFYVDEINYDVDCGHIGQFHTAARDMLPFLSIDDISPDTAGIRPKIQAEGEDIQDFVIKHERSASLNGLINLFGIESPGLTACLSIGKYVQKILMDDSLL
jgi:L-2-hydroxyglutarate oxidase LhgO